MGTLINPVLTRTLPARCSRHGTAGPINKPVTVRNHFHKVLRPGQPMPYFTPSLFRGAVSSVVERLPDTQEVVGSKPAPRTTPM